MELFNKFKYLYPPRTETDFPYGCDVVDMWKTFPDAVAQLKMNGNRNLIYKFPDGHLEFFNRHGERQQYLISDKMSAEIKALMPEGKFSVIDSELLHTKTKTVKNVIYIYDCLVWDGEYLIGKKYSDRYNMIKEFNLPYMPLVDTQITENLYVAENIAPADWDARWAALQECSYCEGFVYKRTGFISKLTHGYQKINNSAFMCKSRKPTKNFQH